MTLRRRTRDREQSFAAATPMHDAPLRAGAQARATPKWQLPGRFSDTEWGAIVRAVATEHPVADRRPSLAGWMRNLIVAHASDVLGVEVTRSALRHAPGGVANWKRWRLARAVRRAAPRRRKTRPRGSPRGTPDRKR